LDIKRSDTPSSVRKSLDNVIDLLFEGDNQKLIDFIDEYAVSHKKENVDYIAIPSGISDITKYEEVDKSVPMHVRASKVMNDLILKSDKVNDYPLVVNGDKIKYVFLKPNNPIKSDIIAFKDPRMLTEFNLLKYVDYPRLFERTFISPVEKLVESIDWRMDSGSAVMADLF
jgi:hypothetical protein